MHADLLMRLGVSRSAAEVLLILLDGEARTATDLAVRTGRSRGAVAGGLRELRDHGWVQSAESAEHGRGRPAHIWSLAVRAGDVARAVEAELERHRLALRETLRAAERLRSTLGDGSLGPPPPE